MMNGDIKIEPIGGMTSEALPDGSTVVVDGADAVHSLNATAAAAFQACWAKTTLNRVGLEMSRILDVPVADEVADAAVAELERIGLVRTSGAETLPDASRRSALRAIGAAAGIAVPVALSLTAAEQKMYAAAAASAGPPSFGSINPSLVCRIAGASFPYNNVVITGINTNFNNTTTVAVSGGYITVSNVRVTSPTSITVDLTVAAGTTIFDQVDITITTGALVITAPQALQVLFGLGCATV